MPVITIHVHRPDGEETSFEAPASSSAEAFFLDYVVRHFNLPAHKWMLIDRSTKREIDPAKTLEGNGVQPDHHLELAEKQTIRCQNCGRSNPAGKKFCAECGTSLTVKPPFPEPAKIKLHLHTPDGRTRPVDIGLDLSAEELLDEMRRAGMVPRIGSWRIYDEAGRELRPVLNLEQNGIHSGQHLFIKGEEPPPPPPPPKPDEVTVHTPEGRAASVEVSVEISVVELIEKLIELGIIPKKNEQGQVVQWSVTDQGGQELNAGRKLNENGVTAGHHIYLTARRPPPPPSQRKWVKPIVTAAVVAALVGAVYVAYTILVPRQQVSVTVRPASITLAVPPGQYKFAVTVNGSSNRFVQWTTDCPAEISPMGLFRVTGMPASPTGCTVTATAAADPTRSDQSSVTLRPEQLPHPPTPGPISLLVVPQSATVAVGGQQHFEALLNGNQHAVFWKTTCPLGSQINSDGLFVAPKFTPTNFQDRSCVVTATTKGVPARSAYARVTLVASQSPLPPPTSVVVTPQSQTIALGRKQQFRALVNGSTQEATWRTDCPFGSTITPNGMFLAGRDAPTSFQETTCQVVATTMGVGTRSGYATVKLISEQFLTSPVPHQSAVGPVHIPGQVMQANLIRKVQPVYPAEARAARVQGTVEFTARISKQGTVENLQLVRGAPLLVNAAEQAVRQWQYRPMVVNGQAVEVITDVVVNFTLSS